MSRRGPRRKSSDSLPALPRDGLRIVPLGGLGEIGRNMTVFEHAGRLLIVDCGVLFPEEHQPGVDVILPDFTWIRDRLDKVDAIVLTHGHEDHIGGVPYLLRERPDIPVVGSRLTLAFLEAKLDEHRITPRHRRGRARATGARSAPSTASSSPSTTRSPTGSPSPSAPRPGSCCTPATSRWTSSRSTAGSPTCARSPGWARRASTSSSSTRPTPRSPASPSPRASSPPRSTPSSAPPPGRVIVSSFASHVHRIQQILDAAQRHGRKVAFVGRSMVRNMGIARELGYLNIPDGPGRQGPQGTSSACAADQIARSSPPGRRASRWRPWPGWPTATTRSASPRATRCCMASSLIPGNENAIYRVINELTRWGANVVHKGNAKVHVSGHASAGELAYCYNIIRPSNVLPVHGEWRHLRANADIAIRTGVDPEAGAHRPGRLASSTSSTAGRRITGTVPAGLVYVDAMTVGGATEESLHVRRTLAEEGVVTIVCIVDPDTGKLTEDPDYLAHGFAHEAMDFAAATPAIQTALTKAAKDGIEDIDQIEELVRRAASTWAHRTHRRSPLIIPVIVDA